VAATSGFLVTVGRIVMLAIMVGAVLRAVQILITVIVRPGWLHFPTVSSYVAFILAVATNVLMLAIALNSTYLPNRLFAADRLGKLFLAVWACGAAAIIVGLLGSFQLGAYVAAEVLPVAVAFVLIGLISPGLYRRPADDSGTTGHDRGATSSDSRSGPDSGSGPDSRSGSGSGDHGRQRRGGRARR
jgi:hypothetical protein